MQKTVAIICEYNPFHNGHKYQIDKIRERFEDATIICIMSGNVTQRGEFAFLDKYTRAKAAVLSGANAVFELPFPFSASNSEIFAKAGVKIANDLGTDYLCFGSESGNLEYLEDIASIIESNEFELEIKKALKNKSESYLALKEQVLQKLGKSLPKSPNDMLAIEYIRAIKKIGSKMLPYFIKREGNGYNELDISDMMSATAIRNEFYKNKELLSIPKDAKDVFENEISNGKYLDKNKANEFLYFNTLKSIPNEIDNAFDAPVGSGYFITELAKNCLGTESFFEGLSSKTYTYSRLRRIIMYNLMGVKEIKENIGYVTLLATDKIGREFIKSGKKNRSIKIITKQSDTKNLKKNDMELYRLSKKADELFISLQKKPYNPSEAYKKISIIL